MRSFIAVIVFTFLYIPIFTQNILLIGSGESRSNHEHSEILRYYSKKADNLSYLDGDTVRWGSTDLSVYDIIWMHRTDSLPDNTYFDNPEFHKAMLIYIENGGNILLTQHALDFLNKSGLEPVAVEHRTKESQDNGYGRMLGFHSFRHHPIFDSLNGGAYVWKPPHDTTVSQCGFFGDAVPENGKVLAVDWDYIFVRETSKLIVEYKKGKGKILGIGAYFNLFEPNLNRLHYDVFYNNVFEYLLGRKEDSPSHYWLYGNISIKPLEHILKRQMVPPPSRAWDLEDNWMALGRDIAQNEYCEVAGRRMLIAAYEPGGIFEVWAHPFMAFRDYNVKIYFDDSTYLLGESLPSIEVTPEAVVRNYAFSNGAILREVIVVSPDRPAGVIHYEYDGPKARLGIIYRSNMRLMWPYSEKVLKTLQYGYQPGLNAMEINAPEGDIVTFLGSNKIPVSKFAGPTNMIDIHFSEGEVVTNEYNSLHDTLFEVTAGQLFELDTHDHLDIIFAAGSEGRDSLAKTYMSAMQDPESLYRQSFDHYRDLQHNMLSVTTPDENFNKGYAWAVAATDRFFVTTPGLGTSIVAGYNGTDRGWDGGHKINGRPGYAWYFGRDAVWSAFAILDYGDYEGVKQILEMFVKYQDLNGKIFHELSTSGFVHYDASDATPLFIILAGRYLDQSGDIEYISKIWPSIKKAYDYCLSTDTDGDGLIENTNVGHGWVEGGHLFGSHTSLYLASCWADACRWSSKIAKTLGFEKEGFEFYRHFLEAKSKIIEMGDSNTGFYYQGIYANGEFHKEQSILPSIPLYFDLIPLDPYDRMLKSFASHAYTTDWGVRLVSLYNEHYHPRGYHSGAVWPLYTGWVSLAEYFSFRHMQGTSHAMQNLNNYREFSLGYVEEVLNGDKHLPSGVCPHQCWSETMVLMPIIEGTIGYGYESSHEYYSFYPSFPFSWDSVEVRSIPNGKHHFNFRMIRDDDKTTFIFDADTLEKAIYFWPMFLPGSSIKTVKKKGEKIVIRPEMISLPQGYFLPSEIVIDKESVIEVYHTGGISLIPPNEKTARGEESHGIRIIESYWEHNTYTIEVEGAPANTYELELINNFGTPESVTGAESFREEGDRLFLRLDFPALNQRYTARTIKIIF